MNGSARYLLPACRLAGLLGLLAVASCTRKAPEAAVAPAWLARVDGELITEDDVRFEIQRRQETKRPMGDAESILQDLIQRKVMLRVAAKSEVMQDPAVRRELENRQLGQWLDRSLQVERDQVRISDDEMRAHYDAHRDQYTRPAMVRLAVLYRQVNARDPEETTASLRAELEKGRAAFLVDPAAATQQGRIPGFGAVSAEYSEDTLTRYRGGDLGWLDTSSTNQRHPAAVLAAGSALDVGGVSDVIETGEGLYVVMKADQRAAQTTPYEEVAPTLRRHLIRARQEHVEKTFVSNLLAGARIEVDREKVARLAVPAPAVPAPPALQSPSEWRPEPGSPSS
jgi:peptidyl-prolyl cis-trans isomerase C